MEKKQLMDILEKNIIAQFQVGFMSYPNLNDNKALKYQVKIIMVSTFDKKTGLLTILNNDKF